MRAGTLAAVALLALGAAAGPAGTRMGDAAMAAAFAGTTLEGIYADGTYFTEAYHDDGSIRYWDATGADSGEWSIEDGKFCTFYEGLQGACFVVERDGDNCFTFREKDPDTGEIDPDTWTSRGWNRARKPTCPVPPEIRL